MNWLKILGLLQEVISALMPIITNAVNGTHPTVAQVDAISDKLTAVQNHLDAAQTA